MPNGVRKRGYIACPFYRMDDGKWKLTCEGIVDGSTISQNYRCKADLEQQIEVFCCDYYKNCEIYRMLMEAKY